MSTAKTCNLKGCEPIKAAKSESSDNNVSGHCKTFQSMPTDCLKYNIDIVAHPWSFLLASPPEPMCFLPIRSQKLVKSRHAKPRNQQGHRPSATVISSLTLKTDGLLQTFESKEKLNLPTWVKSKEVYFT